MTSQIRFWKHKYKKCHKTKQDGRQAATRDLIGEQGHRELGCAERPVGKGGFKIGLYPCLCARTMVLSPEDVILQRAGTFLTATTVSAIV